ALVNPFACHVEAATSTTGTFRSLYLVPTVAASTLGEITTTSAADAVTAGALSSTYVTAAFAPSTLRKASTESALVRLAGSPTTTDTRRCTFWESMVPSAFQASVTSPPGPDVVVRRFCWS